MWALVLFIPSPVISSFVAMIITTAVRGCRPTRNVNMGCNKVLSQSIIWSFFSVEDRLNWHHLRGPYKQINLPESLV